MTPRSCPDHAVAIAIAAALSVVGCARADDAPRADVQLVLAAYSAPREAFEQRILPAFEAKYRRETGKTIKIDASYLASGAQARAVVSGFEADVAALALEPDLERIERAKLITHAWRDGATFATTEVVFAVRPGNPKRIEGFADLARDGVEVLLPNPRTSGGAMWNLSAIWYAALGGDAGVPANDRGAAEAYLGKVLGNVLIMDKAARESMITFEKGVGDVAVTYESEIAAGREAGRVYDEIVPKGTMRVDAVAAVVDVYADRHGVRDAAEKLVAYLRSNEAREAFAASGFRAPGADVSARTIASVGGWPLVTTELFAANAVFPRVLEHATTP